MKINPGIKKSQWALRFRKLHTLFMLIIVLTSSCSSFQKAEQNSVLDITDFGIKPGTGVNAIFAVQEASEKAKSIDGEVRSKRFKAFHKRKYTLSFEACKDVEVSGNTFEGDVLGKKHFA